MKRYENLRNQLREPSAEDSCVFRGFASEQNSIKQPDYPIISYMIQNNYEVKEEESAE